jgi:O-antigen/teichoic acid export membrane protein
MSALLRVAAGDMASKALLVGINLYLIHRLDVGNYAEFTLLLNAMFLAYQLACAPLERLYIGQHERFGHHLGSMHKMLAGAAAVGVLAWLGSRIDLPAAAIVLAGVVVLSTYQVLRIRLQQQEHFAWFSLAEVLKNGLWLPLLLAALALPGSREGAMAVAALVLASLLAMLSLRRFAHASLPASKNFGGSTSPQDFLRVLLATRHVVAYSLIAAVIPYMPIVLASHEGPLATATYGAALRYQAILGMAVYALNTVLLPSMAAASRTSGSATAVMSRVFRWAPLAVVAFAAVAALIWVALPWIDGGRYPQLGTVFLILALPPALSLASTPFVNLLLIQGRTAAVMVCMATALAMNLLSFKVLEAYAAGLAPAWASVVAYLVVAVGVAFFARNMGGRP